MDGMYADLYNRQFYQPEEAQAKTENAFAD